eukprot:CAMPEP_0184709490 /NCGR_PEP_ID=MMETSP0314-20130426/618_1 /TAXON_ID=38298 /ORGANISM="Rhodella maculata, Strain CCMP 736" /LENGTH=300 /DNA_ID=CAMNT_0027171201 /DNA_START=1 /DNA_END=898 /DNA_ORIENTATION=-
MSSVPSDTPTVLTRALSHLNATLVAPLSSPLEALSALIHAALLAHSFRPLAPQTDPPSLPPDWSAGGFGSRYKHPDSAMTFEIRVAKAGKNAVIHAVSEEDEDNAVSVELEIKRFVREGADLALGDASKRTPETGVEAVFTDKVGEAVDALTHDVVFKLVPGAAKEGYEPRAGGGASGSSAAEPPRNAPRGPGYDDGYLAAAGDPAARGGRRRRADAAADVPAGDWQRRSYSRRSPRHAPASRRARHRAHPRRREPRRAWAPRLWPGGSPAAGVRARRVLGAGHRGAGAAAAARGRAAGG